MESRIFYEFTLLVIIKFPFSIFLSALTLEIKNIPTIQRWNVDLQKNSTWNFKPPLKNLEKGEHLVLYRTFYFWLMKEFLAETHTSFHSNQNSFQSKFKPWFLELSSFESQERKPINYP